MPGPLPNPNARRRNKSSEWTTLEGRRQVIPDLPGEHAQAVHDAWLLWWSSPMATQWTDADVPTVLLAALAYGEALSGSLQAAAEFRQMCDRLGLSPLARQRNRWHIAEDGPVEADGPAAKVRKLHAV